ncbi:MAG: hypothetical protein ACOCUQ_04175 [Bacteroidota bacterium]
MPVNPSPFFFSKFPVKIMVVEKTAIKKPNISRVCNAENPYKEVSSGTNILQG